MKEFDYELDYKSLDFTDAETRKLYRIGRGEQGVLYTDDICAHWRFVDEVAARKSSSKIYEMFCQLKPRGTSLVWHSWRWVFVGMLIIPVEGSIIKALVKSDPKTKIGERIQKQRVLLFLRKLETRLLMMKNMLQ